MKLEIYWIEKTDADLKNFGSSKFIIDEPNNKNFHFSFDKMTGFSIITNNTNFTFKMLKNEYYIKVDDNEVIKIVKIDQLCDILGKLFNTTVPTYKTFKMFEKMENIAADFKQ